MYDNVLLIVRRNRAADQVLILVIAADLLEPSLPAAAPSGAAARLGRLGSFSPARGSVRRGKR